MKIKAVFISIIWILGLTSSLPVQNDVHLNDKTLNPGGVVFNSNEQCKADFNIVTDSLTSFPFYYHFNDLSTGNINIWHWDFGDGSTSTERHPSHQYDKAGTYSICLTVADISDPEGCNDQKCLQVTTLDYFSLGGLVYAGDYPLNNPEIAGDTGIASLYRIVNDQIVFVEDHFFQDYGYYWFGYLFPGEYMLKIGLTKGSPNYHNYFTTYYGGQILWTKAELFTISNNNIYDADIHLQPVQLITTGQGIVRGYVNFEQGSTFSTPPISQTTVILMDADRNPVQFTQPDAAGYFEFYGIPFDSYFVTADATGKPSSTVSFTLSGNDPLIEGINLTIFGSNANFIRDNFQYGISLIHIYPNPIKENLVINYYSGVSANTGIKIMDLSGRVFFNLPEKLETGFGQLVIPASSWPRGIYLLVLQPEGYYLPVTAKFIK